MDLIHAFAELIAWRNFRYDYVGFYFKKVHPEVQRLHNDK